MEEKDKSSLNTPFGAPPFGGAGILSTLLLALFAPEATLGICPPIPKVDEELFAKANEEERANLIQDAIEKDEFWGRLHKKILDEGECKKFIEATKEIDDELQKLQTKKSEMMKLWVANKL